VLERSRKFHPAEAFALGSQQWLQTDGLPVRMKALTRHQPKLPLGWIHRIGYRLGRLEQTEHQSVGCAAAEAEYGGAIRQDPSRADEQ
jgi:hypothetical protein